MCTDLTKQEILFFLAMWPDFPRGDVELAEQMQVEATNLGWPEYLVRLPMNIEALNKRSLRFGFISKGSRDRVMITEKGRHRLRHIVDKYSPVAELIRERIREIDAEFA